MKKTNLEKNMDELFDLEESPPIAEQKQELITAEEKPKTEIVTSNDVPSSKDIEADYEYARKNLYDIIENGSSSLEALVSIANASESPRAFEVVSNLMKTLMDANKDLLDIQSKVKKLKQDEPTKNETNVTNNSLFVGSTAELQKMLKDNKDSDSDS